MPAKSKRTSKVQRTADQQKRFQEVRDSVVWLNVPKTSAKKSVPNHKPRLEAPPKA